MTAKVIEKEVLRPGTYWYVDESTGLPAKASFTPEEVARMHKDGKDMLAAGLSIPVPLEHQRDLRAMTASEKAALNLKNNAGWVTDYRLKKVKNDDGTEVEALFSDVSIADVEIANKLPNHIKWTSPWISSFTDGNGKSWNNVVTHLALTTRPRIVNQLPFPSIGAAMSLAANLLDKKFDAATATTGEGGGLFSRAGLLRQKSGTFSPAFPMAFSLYSGVKLAADEMPPKKDKKKPPVKAEGGGDKPGTDDGDAQQPKTSDDAPPDPNMMGQEQGPLVDPDGDIAIYDVVQDLLEALGIVMQDGSEDDFCERLYQATMDTVKNKAGTNDMSTNSNPAANPTNPAKSPLIQESPPLYMSLEDAQKIADPTTRSLALSLIDLRSKHERLEKNAIESAKLVRQGRIERLAKKVSPKVKDMLLTKLAGATFSMGDDGAVKDSLDDTLTMLEASIPDLPALLTVPSAQLSMQDHPTEFEGGMSEERRQAVVDMMCKSGGVPEPKKAAG